MTKPGTVGTYEVVVEDRHTAHALGNKGVRVLATPMLAHFCALAARNAVTPGLGDGEVAVHLRSTVAHLKAAPPGARLVATARVTEVEGGRIGLAVDAWVAGGTVMAGTQTWTTGNRAAVFAAAER